MLDSIKESEHEKRFVWVKDKAGDGYVWRVTDLKGSKNISEDDLIVNFQESKNLRINDS